MSEMWQRIRRARMDAGLTQEQVATACKTTRAAVSSWETPNSKRRTRPKYRHLASLAHVLNVPIEELFDAQESDAPNALRLQEDARLYASRSGNLTAQQIAEIVAGLRTDMQRQVLEYIEFLVNKSK